MGIENSPSDSGNSGTKELLQKGWRILKQRRSRDVKQHLMKKRAEDIGFDLEMTLIDQLPAGTVRSQSTMHTLSDDPVVRGTYLHYADLQRSMILGKYIPGPLDKNE